MTGKLWDGVFEKKVSSIIEDFTASISFDRKLAKHDIKGSIAHVEMLARCKLISFGEQAVIIKGLKEIADEIASGKFRFSAGDEDIHLAIEKRLYRKIGKAAGKLHTARSRNDQVALDLRLFLRSEIRLIIDLLKVMQGCIVDMARENIRVVMPGFTHLQHAQPVLFSHHIMTYFYMLERDRQRLADCMRRVDCLPLGAGAFAGTSLLVDRKFLAKKLGFSIVCEHSIDAVSDRDFVIEFLAAGAVLMMHLSRLSEEIILWASPEFDFIRIDETVLTGSSMMPQKRNPDVPELIRGKCGRVYGNLVNTLTMMKGLPLAYNRDMQEDKEALFDTVETLKKVLAVCPHLLKAIRLNVERMNSLAGDGFTAATDLAEYLVEKGIPFREAHQKVGRLVLDCIKEGKSFEDLNEKDFGSFKFDAGVKKIISPAVSVKRKRSLGSTSPAEVKRMIRKAERILGIQK